MTINRKAAGALCGCETVEDIDEIFAMFQITGLSEKIGHLIAAMGDPEIFMVPGDGKDESKYATILAAFLTENQRSKKKDWRVDERRIFNY